MAQSGAGRSGKGFLVCPVENATTWGNGAISVGDNFSAKLYVLIPIYKKQDVM